MEKVKTQNLQDIRHKRLFNIFSDMTYNFSDWYRATQVDINQMEQEVVKQ